MNRLPLEKRAQIVNLLCEGVSLRATSRMADVSINTVTKLLVEVGAACQRYHDETVRDVKAKRVQCDEIRTFVYAKQKNVSDEMPEGAGDAWTWTALDSDSKLVLSWLIGPRDAETASVFMADVKERLANRVQLATDGLKAYLEAVDASFGAEVDYAQLVKMYGAPAGQGQERRYSPAECTGGKKTPITGNPDAKHVSTSHVERHNLTIRMHVRRFKRLTNAFSKKLANHAHAVALFMTFYNFCRIHKTLRVTPAMEAGLIKTPWTAEDLVRLADSI
jgi:IS1 family transposase